MSIRSKKLALLTFVGLFALLLAACSGSAATAEPMEDMHDDEAEHDEADHEDDGVERIPNNGAVIRLIAPEDGAVIAGGEVEFVVEVENFTLGEDGNHWHIYIDGQSWGMVLGETTSQVLRGIPEGPHRVEVFLSNGDHQDLEDFATADFTIE